MLYSVIFSIGILILVFTQIYVFKRRGNLDNIFIWNILSVILLSISWILREKRINEKYYDYAYQDGKLVAGTVFVSYPSNVPGLGWL
jgi:hypothetical protein